MKAKTIWIIISIILITVAAFLYWRYTRVSRRYPPMRKRIIAPVAKKIPKPLPSIVKKFKNPKVAIVVDDFGYNLNNVDEFFNIKKPITLSILPHLRYSKEIADIASSNGYEYILHLPLEPHKKDVRQEVDTINSRMDVKEVETALESAIDGIPGLGGVSNHMGSKSTEEKGLMTIILSGLKRHGLYFFDSLTSEKSVCEEVAKQVGIRYAKRDIFLDMGSANDIEYIRRQVLALRKLAYRRGFAIAVCHDRKNTVKVLGEMMPELAAEGVQFVYLSELVK